MRKVKLESFNVIGIAVRTSNKDQQSSGDIARLWERFFAENILPGIPDKVNEDIYCVYTEYEGDFTQPYTTLIGCDVYSLDNIPEGMKGITLDGGNYVKLTAKGEIEDGIVVQEWTKVWQSNLSRTYKADFEIYRARNVNNSEAEIDIFVGVK